MRVERFAALSFLAVFLVYPLCFILYEAFVPFLADIGTLVSILASDRHIALSTLNSINLAIAVTMLSSAVGIPVALLLGRRTFAGKWMLQPLLFLPLVLPPFVGAIGVRRFFSRFGPLNLLLLDHGIVDSAPDWLGSYPWLGTAVMQTLHLYPIISLNVVSSILALDEVYFESAALCGASAGNVRRRILLPLLRPGWAAGACIVFIWSLTDLGTPLMFGYRQLLSVEIFDRVEQVNDNPIAYLLVSFMLLLTTVLTVLSRSAALRRTTMSTSKGAGRRTVAPLRGWSRVAAPTLLGVLLVMVLLPHVMVLLLGLTDRWFMTALPESYTIHHFLDLASHPLTVRSFGNSAVLAVSSMSLDLALGLVFALWLARGTGGVRRALDTILMLPLALPGIVLAFGYLGTFSRTFLDPRVNPFILLACGYAVRRLPFMVRTVSAALEQLNPAYEEAAALSGAAPGIIRRRITYPLVLPAIAAGCLLCFVFALLEVSESLILAPSERFFPITKALYALLNRPDGVYIACSLGFTMTVVLGFTYLTAKRLLGSRAREVLGG